MKSAIRSQITRNRFSMEFGSQSQIQLSSDDPGSTSIEPAPTKRPPTSTSRTRLSEHGHRAAAPPSQRQRRAAGAALRAHSSGSRTRAHTGTHTHRPGGINQRPPSKFLYLRPGLAQSSEAEPEEVGVFGLISLRASYQPEPHRIGHLRLWVQGELQQRKTCETTHHTSSRTQRSGLGASSYGSGSTSS